jgi:hypothetical protein
MDQWIGDRSILVFRVSGTPTKAWNEWMNEAFELLSKANFVQCEHLLYGTKSFFHLGCQVGLYMHVMGPPPPLAPTSFPYQLKLGLQITLTKWIKPKPPKPFRCTTLVWHWFVMGPLA